MSEAPHGSQEPSVPDSTEKFGPDFAQKLQGLESGVSLEEQEIIATLPSNSALLIVRKGPNAALDSCSIRIPRLRVATLRQIFS